MGAIICPQAGISFTGTKIPLIKITGNLIRLESIITCEGSPVGGNDKIFPRAEKQKEDKTILNTSTKGLTRDAPNINKPIERGTREMIIPNKKLARISPKSMVEISIGAATRSSSVLNLVSHGKIRGTTEDAVKNKVIPTMPGTRVSKGTFLPIAKARKRNMGKRTPNIRTGGFK